MSAPPLFIRSSPAVRRLRLLELPRQISTSQEPTASPALRGRPAPYAPLVTASIGGLHSLRSAKRGWSSSVLLVHPEVGVASIPLALYVRASSVQSFEPCHSASTFTRAPGRPQVRRGFWLQVLPSQAALPHAIPLSLAADQHFSGALLRSQQTSPPLRGRPAPSAPLVAIGGRRSVRSVKRGWSSSVLLVHSGAGVAGVPLALYVRVSSV
ncbi:hypothetical protein NDU88_001224 [Pleurodeles waltl]|uniref:Uncharacterized protein n=1 Tax=Pleurodeles waltl TaxID=8319 RepID=A0AAV7VWX2_PLEWA|nr:hypothetical protein NDU88_001224 [Pleurodeles waltl]